MKELVNVDKKLPVESHHRAQETRRQLDTRNGSAGSAARARVEHKTWSIEQKATEVVVKTETISSTKAGLPLHSIENRASTVKMDHSTSDKSKCEGRFEVDNLMLM